MTTIKTFEIFSKITGASFGIFEARTEELAVYAMLKQVGATQEELQLRLWMMGATDLRFRTADAEARFGGMDVWEVVAR